MTTANEIPRLSVLMLKSLMWTLPRMLLLLMVTSVLAYSAAYRADLQAAALYLLTWGDAPWGAQLSLFLALSVWFAVTRVYFMLPTVSALKQEQVAVAWMVFFVLGVLSSLWAGYVSSAGTPPASPVLFFVFVLLCIYSAVAVVATVCAVCSVVVESLSGSDN